MKTLPIWACLLALLCCSAPLTSAQNTSSTQAPQLPNFANYSIMLVNPAGAAVVLMHSPKNELEYVDVAKTKEAFAAGYVPLRTAEISELIVGLNDEVIRLRSENERLRQVQAKLDTHPSYAPVPPPVDYAAQQQAQAAADKAARRQQLFQAWVMLQAARPQAPAFQPMPLPAPMQVYRDNRVQANCVTDQVGNTAYTSCN